MKLVFFILATSLLSSCAHRSPKEISAGFLVAKEAQAPFERAQALYDLGEIDAAIASLRMFVDNGAYQPSHDKAYELIVEWLLQLKQKEEATKIASYYLAHYPHTKSAQTIIGLFDKIEEAPAQPKPTTDPAEPLIQDVPADETNPQSFELQQQDEEQKEDASNIAVDPKAIGIILPLTGTYGPFGKRVLAALGLAFELPLDITAQPINSFIKDDLRIIVADSKSDPQVAEHAVDELIKTHHVALIIGEITPQAGLSAAKRAEQLQTPMLSLVRHELLKNAGDNIFIFNTSSERQIEKLLDYAMTEKGHKQFAILYPRHNYGITMSQLFFNGVLERGGSITGIEAYDAEQTDISEPVKKLVGTYYTHARNDSIPCPKNASDCQKLLPIVDFDALFIPEFQKVAYVVPALMQEDILISNNAYAQKAYERATKISPHPVQLLGTGSWNDPQIIKKIARQVDGAYFVDTISFDSTKELADFSKSFTELTKSTPSSLEVFAHDAAKLAVVLLQSMVNPKRAQIKDKIAAFNGRTGLINHLSFKNTELNVQELGFEIISGAVHALPSKP